MLRGAVIQGDKVYHPICMEDAGKQFTVSGRGLGFQWTLANPWTYTVLSILLVYSSSFSIFMVDFSD